MLTGRVRVCVHLARPSACTGTRLPHPPAALAAQSELRLGYGVLRCVSTLRSGGASTRWSTATRKAASARRRSTNASAAVENGEPDRFYSNFCPNLKYLDHLSRNHQHPAIGDAGNLFDQFVRHKGYRISLQQCQWLLGIAKRLGEWKRAKGLIEHMLKIGLVPTVSTYNIAISCCTGVEQSKAALDVFELMQTRKGGSVMPDITTYASVLKACRQGTQGRLALAVLERMQEDGIEPNIHQYNSVLITLTAAGRWQDTVFLFERMRMVPELELDGLSINTAVMAYSQGKKWEHVLAVRDELKNKVDAGVITNYHFITALRNTGQVDKIIGEYEDFVNAGGKPDLLYYQHVMICLNKSRLWAESLRVYDDMCNSDVAPNAAVYFAALSACRAGQQWQRIRAILDRVRTAPVEPTVHMYNIAMDTYKGAIKRGAAEGSGPAAQLRVASAACLPAPTCETVMDLLKEMGDVGVTPDIYSYNIAITANMFAGRWKPIMALLNEMGANGVKADVHSYNVALAALKHRGLWQQSLDMLEGLPKVGVTPDDVTYSTIMCTCNEAGQYAQTIALYKQMVAKGLRVNDVAGRRVVTAHQSLGGTMATEQLIHVFPSVLSPSREDPPAVSADALPAQPYGKATGHAERVRAALVARGALAHELHESHRGLASRLAMPAMHMNALLISAAEAGLEQSDACAPLEPVSAIQLAPVKEPGAAEYRTALNACRHNLQWETALHLFKQMIQRELSNTPEFKYAMSTTMAICMEAGQWHQAVHLYRALFDTKDTSNIEFDVVMFERALKACLAGKSWQAALRVLKDMRSVGVTPSCLAYNMAMEACIRGDQPQHIAELLNEMNEVGVDASAYTMDILMQWALKTQQYTQVLELYQETIALNLEPKLSMLNAVARSLEFIDSHVARPMVHSILSDMTVRGLRPDQDIYKAGALALVRHGDVKGIELLLDDMREHRIERSRNFYRATLALSAKLDDKAMTKALSRNVQRDGMHEKLWTGPARPTQGQTGKQTSPLDRRRGPAAKHAQQPRSNTHKHIPALADEPAISELHDNTTAHSRLDAAHRLANSTITYGSNIDDSSAHHDTNIIIGT